jgi:hypothetical protein
MSIRQTSLAISGSFCMMAVSISFFLIRQHQMNMTRFSVQSKIVGIIWMVPIYSLNSFSSLLFPAASLYIDMLRDCYEAYVLYLFLSLMLSYLKCDGEDDRDDGGEDNDYYKLIVYLETKQPPPRLPFPFSIFYKGDLPKGKEFLKFCKFGTLQYCIVRPLTTLIAIILNLMGLYHEATFGIRSSWMYLVIIMNISIAFAFAALATFYTTLKKKLSPYEPIGKFLCIKFVIFVAFWQSVVIAILVRIGVIHAIDGYSTHSLSRGLQDVLVCVEMCLVSIAHLYTFSYYPFTEEGFKAGLKDKARPLDVGLLDDEVYDDSSSPVSVASQQRQPVIVSSVKQNILKDGYNPHPQDSMTPHGYINRHFAGSAAVRDFNESMPVFVLPSNFKPERGLVRASRPSDRVKE